MVLPVRFKQRDLPGQKTVRKILEVSNKQLTEKGRAQMNHFNLELLGNGCELLACLFLAAIGIIVLYKIATNKIDLEWLISEDNGHASMSRFQLLVFTFVIAISFVKLTEVKSEFPWVNSGVLTLLGISASTYAVGKGIQKSGENGEEVAPNTPKPPPVPAPTGAPKDNVPS
jgi:hypothetical protein